MEKELQEKRKKSEEWKVGNPVDLNDVGEEDARPADVGGGIFKRTEKNISLLRSKFNWSIFNIFTSLKILFTLIICV